MARHGSRGLSAEPEDDLLRDGCQSVPDFCRETGLGKSFVYEAMARGELPFVKRGRRRLIPRVAGRRWLAAGLVVGEGAR